MASSKTAHTRISRKTGVQVTSWRTTDLLGEKEAAALTLEGTGKSPKWVAVCNAPGHTGQLLSNSIMEVTRTGSEQFCPECLAGLNDGSLPAKAAAADVATEAAPTKPAARPTGKRPAAASPATPVRKPARTSPVTEAADVA